jgi:hypothetical protein
MAQRTHEKSKKPMKGEKDMKKGLCLLTVLSVVSMLLLAGVAGAQDFPVMNMVADKVIQKYQQSTCEQLWQEKLNPKPKSEMEQRAIQLLRNDPQMRTAFINKVAAPMANKMFECGMIP